MGSREASRFKVRGLRYTGVHPVFLPWFVALPQGCWLSQAALFPPAKGVVRAAGFSVSTVSGAQAAVPASPGDNLIIRLGPGVMQVG